MFPISRSSSKHPDRDGQRPVCRGWIGQIYSEGRYEKGITRRSHKVADKTFNEETLPVESVAEYFEHFPILEIDYTFYRPLLESKGSPSSNYHVLKSYRQQMKKEIGPSQGPADCHCQEAAGGAALSLRMNIT